MTTTTRPSLQICELCGAWVDDDDRVVDPLTTPEELLGLILDEVPQHLGTKIPADLLEACVTVLGRELAKRDRALAKVKSLVPEDVLRAGGRQRK